MRPRTFSPMLKSSSAPRPEVHRVLHHVLHIRESKGAQANHIRLSPGHRNTLALLLAGPVVAFHGRGQASKQSPCSSSKEQGLCQP